MSVCFRRCINTGKGWDGVGTSDLRPTYSVLVRKFLVIGRLRIAGTFCVLSRCSVAWLVCVVGWEGASLIGIAGAAIV
jgi:hypothetical protein